MTPPARVLVGNRKGVKSLVVQWIVHFCVLLLCVGDPVPGVNESHYIPKAKHAWDTSFAPGDFFLESHDSHWLATAAAGLAAWFLPLSGVAWLGRIACWSFVAVAWMRLTRALGLQAWLSPLALAAWFLMTEYGNWAGEWAVGGFEAKSVAYPCVLMALAALMDTCKFAGSWSRVWVWLGLAVAWHPVVGGWAGLTVGIVWLAQPYRTRRLREQFLWLSLAFVLGLVGVLPAASGLGGSDIEGGVAAPQVHVYMRLAHHMSPQIFAVERHVAAAMSLLTFALVSIVFARVAASPEFRSRLDLRIPQDISLTPPLLLLSLAWLSVAFSLAGLGIDLLVSTKQPYLAAKLLRFYWFRWSDVCVPLASVLTFFWLVQLHLTNSLQRQPELIRAQSDNSAKRSWSIFDRLPSNWILFFVTVATLVPLLLHVSRSWDRRVPEADEIVAQVEGRFGNSTDRYTEWLAVCDWIRNNSPSDSLWFTPRHQQTFKWHAGRAEVVCWKDVPQDNATVLEWYRRIKDCAQPRDEQGEFRDWSSEELIELAKRYGFEYILLDRAFQEAPPLLEFIYPVEQVNNSFAICRIRKPD